MPDVSNQSEHTVQVYKYLGHPYNTMHAWFVVVFNRDWRTVAGELSVLFSDIIALKDNDVSIKAIRKPLLNSCLICALDNDDVSFLPAVV